MVLMTLSANINFESSSHTRPAKLFNKRSALQCVKSLCTDHEEAEKVAIFLVSYNKGVSHKRATIYRLPFLENIELFNA